MKNPESNFFLKKCQAVYVRRKYTQHYRKFKKIQILKLLVGGFWGTKNLLIKINLKINFFSHDNTNLSKENEK
jgi:hypothetical protein